MSITHGYVQTCVRYIVRPHLCDRAYIGAYLKQPSFLRQSRASSALSSREPGPNSLKNSWDAAPGIDISGVGHRLFIDDQCLCLDGVSVWGPSEVLDQGTHHP